MLANDRPLSPAPGPSPCIEPSSTLVGALQGGQGGEVQPTLAFREGRSAKRTSSVWRPRLAIVGIGREGRGDDGAGPALCAALDRLGPAGDDRLVVDAGVAPENVSGRLRRFRPDLVVLVDAAEMGQRAGAVRWLDGQCALGCSASTHTLPLGLWMTYLAESMGCEVRLLGIQPGLLDVEGGLSAPVQRAVDRLARHLATIIASTSTGVSPLGWAKLPDDKERVP